MFRNELSFCSNFYSCTVNDRGIIYPSTEHLYQSFKTQDKRLRTIIAVHPSKGLKSFIRSIAVREDWDQIKEPIMRYCCLLKFSQPHMYNMLSRTSIPLIEDNYWHDNFWGHCNCPKCINKPHHNHLGRILMELRGCDLNYLQKVTLNWITYINHIDKDRTL